MLIGLLSIRERLRVLKMLNKNNKNCLRVSCPNGSELIELSNNKAEYYSDLAKKYKDLALEYKNQTKTYIDENKLYIQEQIDIIENSLDDYALESSLDNYALKSSLEDYALKDSLNNYATKTSLENYALESALDDYALKTSLDNYALESTLDNYALKTSLNDYALESSLDDYALKASLNNYALNSSLNNYALKSSLDSYALKTSLNNYALSSQIPTKVSQLQNDASYVKESELEFAIEEVIGDSLSDLDVLPDMTNCEDMFLKTDGTSVLWSKVPSGVSIGTVFPCFAGEDYVPSGALPCDGTEYTKAQFTDLYNNYLVNGNLLTCTYTEYSEDVAAYGSCAKFALDTANEKFKVPQISDGTFIQQASSDSELAKLYNPGLPNITGKTGNLNINGYDQNFEGALFGSDLNGKSAAGSGNYGTRINIDASRSSSVYGNSDTVQPKAAAIRWFVCVANASENESAMNWSQWASNLQGKVNTSANNLTPEAKSYISTFGMPSGNYINLTLGASGSTYTAPANGWISICKEVNAAKQYIEIKVPNQTNPVYGIEQRGVMQYQWLMLYTPILANQTFSIGYDATRDTHWFTFVYAQGEEVAQ